MALAATEDAHDLELQRELEQAFHRYLLAADSEKAAAHDAYISKLDVFSERVLHRQLFTARG